MSRFSLVPASYIIFSKDDEVLLLRRSNTGYLDGFYSLPSGHVDGNESAMSAAVREAKEEVGVDIDKHDLRFVHVMHRIAEEKDHERVDFFFETTKWNGKLTNMEPDKCDDLRWFPKSKLPSNLSPVVAQALQNITDGEHYSDLDF